MYPAQHLAEPAMSKESAKHGLDTGLVIGALVAIGIGGVLAGRRASPPQTPYCAVRLGRRGSARAGRTAQGLPKPAGVTGAKRP